jgi:feruloyl esterase
MPRTKTTRRQIMWAKLALFGAVVGGAILMAAVRMPASAQAFADLKTALVDYSQADLVPRMACEALGKFKSKEIAQIAAMAIAAAADAPAQCRVTGLLSPEVAFEVSLPAKWNGRFYMIGNGGHAGEAMDDPGRVA